MSLNEHATIAYSGLLWLSLEQRGIVDKDSGKVDRSYCLDLLAVCEEHGVQPDPYAVITVLGSMLHDLYPERFENEDSAQAFVIRALT